MREETRLAEWPPKTETRCWTAVCRRRALRQVVREERLALLIGAGTLLLLVLAGAVTGVLGRCWAPAAACF